MGNVVEKTKEILSNKIKCLNCEDVIESHNRQDFKRCSCGSVAVDGGKDYLKRRGQLEGYEELSVVKQET